MIVWDVSTPPQEPQKAIPAATLKALALIRLASLENALKIYHK